MQTRLSEAECETLLGLLKNQFLKHYLPVPNWPQIPNPPFLAEYLSQPGKMLRPLFLLTSYLTALTKLRGGVIRPEMIETIPTSVWEVARRLEIFHSLVLACDDVIDKAELRRGRTSLPQMYREWCLNQPSLDPTALVLDVTTMAIIDLWRAILRAAGSVETDFSYLAESRLVQQKYSAENPLTTQDLFAEVQETIFTLTRERTKRVKGTRYEIVSIYLNALQGTLDGEMTDQQWSRGRGTPTLLDLLWLQREKTTGYSVLLPLQLGILLADANTDPITLTVLANAARLFGEAFQIQDDLLLLAGEKKAGKSVYTDLENASRTFVTVSVYEILPYEQSQPEELTKQGWLELLGQCRSSEEARLKALEVIRACGVAEFCKEEILCRVSALRLAVSLLEQEGYTGDLLLYLLSKGVLWMDDAWTEK